MGDHVMAIRRRLAIRIKAARLTQGLTQQEAADLVFWTPSKYSRKESGQVAVPRSDLLTLLAALQIPSEEHADLLDLAKRSGAKPRFARYESILSEPDIHYFDAAAAADDVCEVSIGLLPMTLRSAAYQSAIISHHLNVHPYQSREDWQLLHAQVSGMLEGVPRPEFTFVIDESALKRHIGGLEVMREQLHQLRRLVEGGSVRLSVVPFSAGYLHGLRSFSILSWRQHPEDDLVAFLGMDPSTVIIQNPYRVERGRRDFKELLEYGTPPAHSAAVLDDALRKL